MKFSRKDYLGLMTFSDFKRPMFVELFGPLVGLDIEWKDQGATQDEINMAAFDWDYLPVVQCGAIAGLFKGFDKIVLEETSEYIIEKDELGRKTKICKGYSTQSLPMDFPVMDMESWLRVKKFYEFSYHFVLDI